MTTLSDALRANDKLDSPVGSLPELCKIIMQGALQAVGPSYGYGIFEQVSAPKVKLGTREIIKQLETIGREIQLFEAVHHHVHIDEKMEEKLAETFRQLPDAVAREGWSADLIIAVSRTCQDLAWNPNNRPDVRRNYIYHSVLGSLSRLDSIPQSIAYPMLEMVTTWSDLRTIALDRTNSPLSTQYWVSTLEIGRQVVLRASEIFSEPGAEEVLVAQDRRNARGYRLSIMSAKRARQIIAENPLVAKLLAA
jgi:hypothetical protein